MIDVDPEAKKGTRRHVVTLFQFVNEARYSVTRSAAATTFLARS
jgi:hypothetical protein